MILEEQLKDSNKTAEEIINGENTDPSYEPIVGLSPSLTDYDVDYDLTKKFSTKLNLNSESIEKINDFLNKKAIKYEKNSLRCPVCGKSLNAVSNDGHFCKFCGAHVFPNIAQPFSETLKEIRKKKGYDQAKLGELIGFSRAHICKMEKGHKKPNLEELKLLSDALNCSVNELFGQDAPRTKISGAITNQNNLPTLTKKSAIKKENIEGYEYKGEETIFLCPHCKKEIDLTPMESLTLGLPSYEVMRMRTKGNDGNFCKHCGQGINRPVEINENKAFDAYKFWIDYARRSL